MQIPPRAAIKQWVHPPGSTLLHGSESVWRKCELALEGKDPSPLASTPPLCLMEPCSLRCPHSQPHRWSQVCSTWLTQVPSHLSESQAGKAYLDQLAGYLKCNLFYMLSVFCHTVSPWPVHIAGDLSQPLPWVASICITHRLL